MLPLLLFLLAPAAWAADPPPVRTLVVSINPQVVETDRSVSWEQPLAKETVPGKPVVINIDAQGLTIRVSVTPFVRGQDFLLVVQGDVRQTSGNQTRGSSNLQSVLVPPGEPIAYFPLGRPSDSDPSRQMKVLIRVEFQGE